MKQKYLVKCKILTTTAICVFLLLFNSVHAAPGNLAQQPLFLGSNVQPNIFFGVDDSGSMGANVIVNNGAVHTEGFASIPPENRFNSPLYYTGEADNYGGTGELIQLGNFSTPRRRRLTCVGYNVLAYNPETNYTPWRGEDSAGNPYTDATLAAARTNPYNPGTTLDIRNFVFFEWTDTDGDGEYDGPAATDPEAAGVATGDECGDVSSTANGTRAQDIIATPSSPTRPAHSQTNFANWFVYYRSREFTAKKAVSELVFQSNHRMGLGTLHNNNNVGTAISDMEVTANKDNLLDSVSQIHGGGSTPTRGMLENIGRYFDKADTGSLTSGNAVLGISNSSPILPNAQGGSCQQNFAVVVSDGFWRDETINVGNDDNDSGPTTSTWDGGSYSDSWSNTLADVAMRYYEKDLATALPGNVKIIPGIDDNTQQHLVGFMVAFGIDGTLTADPTSPTAPFAWPEPIQNTPTTIDDMRHAAWNSRGQFLSAKKPDDLISKLTDALSAIDARAGTSAAVNFNSNELDAGSQLYLTQFNTEDWSGDMLAFDIEDTGPNIGDIIIPEVWATATSLDARTDASVKTNRVIYTYDGTDGKTLLWGSLTNAQKDDFRTNPDGTLEAAPFTVAQKRLDYFRGDRSEEIGASGAPLGFRARGSRMGDVVHSGPTFVGKPNEPFLDINPFGVDGKRYSQFKAAQNTRKEVVYVGANDGMLHAFDTSASGAEIMAYVPSTLFSSGTAESGLHYLTDPAYVHRYYVDATVNTGDAFVLTSSGGGIGSRDWATILVGGLRGGGKGLFALDVTDPSFSNSDTDAANHALWEFNESDIINSGTSLSELGFTFSKPKITLMNNGKWAVIFGNGYNSDHGEASLIILYIEEGLDGTWTAGSDYEVIRTGVGNTSTPNGLGEVTLVDLDGDIVVDYIYAGDIRGNLWAFDVTGSSGWQVAHGAGTPLFTATDNIPQTPGTMQQITVKAAITRTETSTPTNYPNVLVIFGTGQYLTTADPTNTDDQSLYGVWDAGQGNLDRNNLVEQSLTNGATAPTTGLRVMSDNTVTYADSGAGSGVYGWFFDLPDDRERLNIDPIILGDQVLFGTIVPDADPCDVGGTGWIMVLDTQNGGEPTGGGIDVDGDGDFDADDQISGDYVAGVKLGDGLLVGLGILGNTIYASHAGGGAGAGSINSDIKVGPRPTADTGRLSWKELIQ